MEGGGRLPEGGWWGAPVSQQGLVGRTDPRPGPGTPPTGPTLLDLGRFGVPITAKMCGSNMRTLRGTPVCS